MAGASCAGRWLAARGRRGRGGAPPLEPKLLRLGRPPADPIAELAQRQSAFDEAQTELRSALEQLAAALADAAQHEIASAMLPVEGIADVGADAADATEDALLFVDEVTDDVETRLPGGAIVNRAFDYALIPGRAGVRAVRLVVSSANLRTDRATETVPQEAARPKRSASTVGWWRPGIRSPPGSCGELRSAWGCCGWPLQLRRPRRGAPVRSRRLRRMSRSRPSWSRWQPRPRHVQAAAPGMPGPNRTAGRGTGRSPLVAQRGGRSAALVVGRSSSRACSASRASLLRWSPLRHRSGLPGWRLRLLWTRPTR